MLPFILVIMALLVIYTLQSKEGFMETSYYYEAAPGSRGARLICMPESSGTASIGIAVSKAASRAAARVAKRACGPIVDFDTANKIGESTKKTVFVAAKKAAIQVIPEVCKPYISQGDGTVVVRPAGRPSTLVMTKPTCPTGYVFDARSRHCRRSGAVAGVKTSPGCPVGMIWDGKQCRRPSGAVAGVKTSPGCPVGMIWDGKQCRRPSGAVTAVGAGKVGADKSSPGCPPGGYIWDGKACRLPKAKTTLRTATTASVRTSPGCPPGTLWDGAKCRKPSGCGAGRVWDAKKKACRPRSMKAKSGGSSKSPDSRPQKYSPPTKESYDDLPLAIQASIDDPSRP